MASIPAAFVGGLIELPPVYYRPLVGCVLVAAAVRLWVTSAPAESSESKPPRILRCLAVGGGLGLLAGLTGTGGGIFLSPWLLFMRWAGTRQTSAVSAAFILVNSIAGLAGMMGKWQSIPSGIPIWAAAAILGGLVGSNFGSRRLQSLTLRRLLAVVLAIAALKFVGIAG